MLIRLSHVSFWETAWPIILAPSFLSDADRASLERLQRTTSGPEGLSRRARVVLLLADQATGAEGARRTGYKISRLRRRSAEEGVAGLDDKPRPGRPPTIAAHAPVRRWWL